jgi:deoxyribonucleoside regulator
MPNDYSDDRLRLVSRLYYLDGLGQSEVAKFAKVSQAKVSRLLALAKERGIVRITVADYDPRQRDLEEQLQARLGLETVAVIKSSGGFDGADLRRAVGHFGAPVVDALIEPRDIVALAGGRTIHELVHHLPASRAKSLTVVQAMGSVDSTVNGFDAQEVGRVVAQRLGGTFLSLNTPAFIPEKRTRDALLDLEQVRTVHKTLDRARVALVGLGTLANSVFVERGTLDAPMIRELQRAGAVGEVCGRFINASGNECATAWRDRVIGVQVEQLRNIPHVVGVVSGNDRSAAILAAIKGKIIKALVIDEVGAAALLAAAPAARTKAPSRKEEK